MVGWRGSRPQGSTLPARAHRWLVHCFGHGNASVVPCCCVASANRTLRVPGAHLPRPPAGLFWEPAVYGDGGNFETGRMH